MPNAIDRYRYAAPHLTVYGGVRLITRTATQIQFNRNDATQGQQNLKT